MQTYRVTVGAGEEPVELASLSPEMDRAFRGFYQAWLGGKEPPGTDFDPAAAAYFDQHGANPSAVDAYFDDFAPAWRYFVDQSQWAQARNLWEWALRPATAWEGRTGGRLNKRAGYHFAALSALLAGDPDQGYLLARRALEEDRPPPDAAPYALVTLDPDRAHPVAREWVQSHAAFISARLEGYRLAHNRTLDLAGLRARFLAQPGLVDDAFLFAHATARLLRLAERESPLAGAFGARLGLNLLCDLTLVIEGLVTRTEPAHRRLVDVVAALSRKAGLQLSVHRMGYLDALFARDFEQTANRALDGDLVLPDGCAATGLNAALAVAYGCRRHTGHHPLGLDVVRERFDELHARVLQTLFLAVDVYY